MCTFGDVGEDVGEDVDRCQAVQQSMGPLLGIRKSACGSYELLTAATIVTRHTSADGTDSVGDKTYSLATASVGTDAEGITPSSVDRKAKTELFMRHTNMGNFREKISTFLKSDASTCCRCGSRRGRGRG